MEGERDPDTLLQVGMQGAALWKTIWRVLKQIDMEISYHPATQLPGKYPKDRDRGALIQKYICAPMFTAAVFTTVKIRK